MEMIIKAILIGVGATIIMDLWAIFLKTFFSIPSLNYAFVGRWIGHMTKGKYMHQSIATAAPIPGETAIGWMAHYMIGITFSILLVLIWGEQWTASPTIGPALIIGIGTTVAPFFLMQPGMGLGIAASRTPKPDVARMRSLMAHTVYGIGLYLAALLLTRIY
ncbi:DUF2938 domain-containing protein [Chitinophaga flava]|uniref:DUF2938 domain-containing protein n=1 Tax=Chitinophaga flava TaxID=2259036 RepID=A0A365XPN4_9BACT|nr:DUF2938 domain-containing protein [Chitinophaga flava]RBL88078.1 DUF2938 domain-containing protein [Chitinophaga flava]